MSFLTGLFGAKNNNQAPAASGMPLQTSCYGKPIPLVAGTTRIGCNLIDYENFNSTAVSASGGGKSGVAGGGGKGGGATSYTYNADIILALCEGPVDAVGDTVGGVWQSQTEETMADAGLSELPGSYTQTSQNIYTYAGVACAEALQLSLGASAALPQFNFEVSRTTGFNAVNGQDADPSLVVPWLLSDPFIGAGFPPSRIGQLTNNTTIATVPLSGPYTVAVPNAANFAFNLDVEIAGEAIECVAGSPGPGQYSFASGVYTFNAAQAGVFVGINYATLGPLTAYQNFTMASGLWVSPGYDSQTQASSMLDNLATITYSEFVWSSGVLTLVPRGTVNVTGNGYSFEAAVTPLFALTDDDFLPNTNVTGTANAGTNDDPVIVTRSRPSDQINDIKLEFLDRENQYAPGIAEVTDQANIDAFGKRASASSTAHEFADVKAANTSAQLQMQDQYIRNTACITLDQRYCILDPMDVVSIADPELFPNAPGNAALFRILEITENDDGTLSINLEELPVAAGAAAEYSLNSGSGYIANYNVPPGPVNAPILFGMPTPIAGNQGLAIGAALSGQHPANWLGCYVYASSDGASYRVVGKQLGPSRMGLTAADFPAGSDPDLTTTLSVNLSESFGALAAGTTEDADQGNTLCLVGGPNGVEFIAYSEATLTAANCYTLGGYIRRGLYGSPIVDHPAGSPFTRIDGSIFEMPYQASQIGQTMFLKFASFNLYEGGQESLSSVTAYEITVPEPPPPPDVEDFAVSQIGYVVNFSWEPVDYPTVALAGYVLGFAAPGTTDWSKFEILTEVGAGTEISTASVPAGTWLFGIRAANVAYVPGTEIGLSPDIATATLTVLNGPITVSEEADPAWDSGLGSGFFTHYTGVLVPLGTKDCSAYAALAPPSSPTLSEVAGGTLGATTYYVVVTYVSISGETLASGASSIAVGANNLLSVADPSGGSPPANATGWNVYASTSSAIGVETLQNAAPIAFATNWTEPTSGLIAGAALPTANTTGWEWLYGVPDPVSVATYIDTTIDLQATVPARVFFSYEAFLLPTVTGTASIATELDFWPDGGTDPATFTPVATSLGVQARYVKGEIVETTSTGVAAIRTFLTSVQEIPTTEQSDQSVAIAGGGTTIAFPQPFAFPPAVTPTVLSGATALYATVVNVTTTDFDCHIWNSSGVDVGGTLQNWTATGVP